jgi:hypothetical protein
VEQAASSSAASGKIKLRIVGSFLQMRGTVADASPH